VSCVKNKKRRQQFQRSKATKQKQKQTNKRRTLGARGRRHHAPAQDLHARVLGRQVVRHKVDAGALLVFHDRVRPKAHALVEQRGQVVARRFRAVARAAHPSVDKAAAHLDDARLAVRVAFFGACFGFILFCFEGC
jgi:hypothetical protein